MRLYRRAFPDLLIEADDLVIQDDCAAFSWILSGTHRGTIMNIPATGRRVGNWGATAPSNPGTAAGRSFP